MTTQIYEKSITIAINDWENAMELTKQKGLTKQLKHEITLFNIACVWRAETFNTETNKITIRYENCGVDGCESKGIVTIDINKDMVIFKIVINIPDYLFFMSDHQELLDNMANSKEINVQLKNLILYSTPWSIAFKPDVKIKLPILVEDEYPIGKIQNLFEEISLGTKNYEIISSPPVKPEGGELYIYKCSSLKDIDFRSDQYRWLSKGDNKAKNKAVLKKYYEIQTTTGKIRSSSKEFRRHIYTLNNSNEQLQPLVIIHYLGSSNAAIDLPHGNSKLLRPFVGTMPSTKDAIKSQVCLKDGPQETYKNILDTKKTEMSTKSIASKDIEKTACPRDTKQIKNFKYTSQKNMLYRETTFLVC